MELNAARDFAHWWTESLTDHGCKRAVVAGSVRRGKPRPKDIEIVALADWNHDLAGNPFSHSLDTWVANQEHLRTIKGKGATARYYQLRDTIAEYTIDLFVADARNFGLIYLIRTGSADFSHAVASQANRAGYHLHHGNLCAGYDPRLRHSAQTSPCRQYDPTPTPEEADVFEILGIRAPAPKDRNGPDDIKPAP